MANEAGVMSKNKKWGAVFVVISLLLIGAIAWMAVVIHASGVHEQEQESALSEASKEKSAAQGKIVVAKKALAEKTAEAKKLADENVKFADALSVCAKKEELRKADAERAKLKHTQMAKVRRERLAKLKSKKPKQKPEPEPKPAPPFAQAMQSPATPVIAQVFPKLGTPCENGEGVHVERNGQVVCLLNEVVRAPVRYAEPVRQYYRPAPEPEVRYVERVYDEPQRDVVYYDEPQGDVVYYDEPQQSSSWTAPILSGLGGLGLGWWYCAHHGGCGGGSSAPANTGGRLINPPLTGGLVNPALQ